MRKILLGMLFLLAACAGNSGDPAEAVERYLQAKVSADEEGLRGLLCSEMEANLRREVTSFAGVSDVKIEGMECSREGDSDKVTCTGKIVATYGTENTEFPLTSYRVVQEDGEWKWCGETA